MWMASIQATIAIGVRPHRGRGVFHKEEGTYDEGRN